MSTQVTPFLMFEGNAERAMNFYLGLFPDSTIISLKRYGKEGEGTEGTIALAVFALAGQRIMCIDSPVKHAFTLTPAMSLFVDCESEGQLAALFQQLSHEGQVLMPLGNYGFSRQFGWVQDRFGVSWQLNLPNE